MLLFSSHFFHHHYCTHLSKVCSGIDPLQISALKTDVPEEEYRQKDKEKDGKQERTVKKERERTARILRWRCSINEKQHKFLRELDL